MNAKAGVPPAQQLLDQGRIDLSLAPQHREDLVAKQFLELLQIEVGHDRQPAVGRKQAIRDDGMEMGIQVHQIAEGLNRHNDTRGQQYTSYTRSYTYTGSYTGSGLAITQWVGHSTITPRPLCTAGSSAVDHVTSRDQAGPPFSQADDGRPPLRAVRHPS